MSKFAGLGINVDKAVRMPIVYPGQEEPLKDNDGKEAYLELLAEDSAPGRQFEKKLTTRAVNRVRAGGRRTFDEDPTEFQIDKVTALLVGWYLVQPNGEPVTDYPFSQENARALISAPEMAWLRKQAMAFVSDNANFTKASSTP